MQTFWFIRMVSYTRIPFVQLKHPPFHIWYHRCFDTGESGNGDNIGWSHIPLALYPTNTKVCAGQECNNPQDILNATNNKIIDKILGPDFWDQKVLLQILGSQFLRPKFWCQDFWGHNLVEFVKLTKLANLLTNIEKNSPKNTCVHIRGGKDKNFPGSRLFLQKLSRRESA